MDERAPCPIKTQHRWQLLNQGACPVCGDSVQPLAKGGVSCVFRVEYTLLGLDEYLGSSIKYVNVLAGLRLRHGLRKTPSKYGTFVEKDLERFENDL